MRPYSICCKPQLDVFEERKVEASRWSKLLNLPSISMLVLFYYRELMWSTGKFPISNKTSGAWPASCSALERDRERPASQVGGCKPLGQSEYKPFKYTCTALLDCEVYLSTHEVFSKNSAILHIHEAPFRAYSVRTCPSLAAREMRSSQQAGYGSKRKGHE